MDEALTAFSAPDAILAEDTKVQLSKYLENGGSLDAVCDALMESYEGVPDMVRALSDWSSIFDHGEAALHTALETVVKQHQNAIIPRIDEVLSKTPEALSTITALTSSPRWRPLMVDIAGRHKQTTFYDIVARETRLAEAGVSQDAMKSSDDYLEQVTGKLQRLFASATDVSHKDLTNLFKQLSVMCTYDESSTVTALRLFGELSRDTPDPAMRGLFRRISQEIRKEAVRVMVHSSIVPEAMARQYVIRLAITTDYMLSGIDTRKQVIDALVGLLEGGSRRRFDKEIKVLMDQYGRLIGDLGMSHPTADVVETVRELGYSAGEKMILIKALCHPEVFEDLMKALFSYASRTYIEGKPDVGKRRCLCLLLSYSAQFIPMDDREISSKLKSENSKIFLRASMKDMIAKLGSTAEVCETLKPGSPRAKIKGKAVETLLQGVKDPLVARGILIWAKDGLHGNADLRPLLVTAPKHLGFLEALAEHHVILCRDILEVIHKAYLRDYPGLEMTQVTELRAMLMKTVTSMVRFQMGPQVISAFRELWADDEGVGLFHLRAFVRGLFRTVSPPYSLSFSKRVCELLEHERVSSAIAKDADLSKTASEFQSMAEP